MPHKNHKCCMCRRTDDEVKILGTDTPVHPQCMENAALSGLVRKFGWKPNQIITPFMKKQASGN